MDCIWKLCQAKLPGLNLRLTWSISSKFSQVQRSIRAKLIGCLRLHTMHPSLQFSNFELWSDPPLGPNHYLQVGNEVFTECGTRFASHADVLASHSLQWALVHLALFILPGLIGLLGSFFGLYRISTTAFALYDLGFAITYFSICGGSGLVLFAAVLFPRFSHFHLIPALFIGRCCHHSHFSFMSQRRMNQIFPKDGRCQPQPQRPGYTIFILGLISRSVPIEEPDLTEIFEAVADIPQADVKAYRKSAFPDALGDPTNDPFFSVENAPHWMTSYGYQLFFESDESPVVSRNPEDASPRQFKAYRKYMLSDQYIAHPFFSLDNMDRWINPVVFQIYMDLQYSSEQYRQTRTESTPSSSRAPSRAGSSTGSGGSSWHSPAPSSRASSPVSFASEFPSRPASSMSMDNWDQEFPESLSALPLHPDESLPEIPSRVRAFSEVERPSSPALSVASSVQLWTPPYSRLELSPALPPPIEWIFRHLRHNLPYVAVKYSPSMLTSVPKTKNLGAGSTDHIAGDVTVWGLTQDQTKGIWSQHCQFYCNGVETCEFIDPPLFAGCEWYEPDFEQMQELWNHELEENELEAASAPSFTRESSTRNAKFSAMGTSLYGKNYFIGCSKWSRDQRFDHIYWPIAANINEVVLKFAMENDGRLPNEAATVNETCVLTVHPRVGLKNCPYCHIHNGQIKPAKIRKRPCLTQMIVLISVDSTSVKTALVILRNPHNHPAHPQAKPSAEDRIKLGKAVQLAGLTGLTAYKLINASSTSVVYNGQRVAESSPAFTSRCKVRDFIDEAKKKEYPQGMGWEGVLYELSVRETKLLKVDRYIHTAMSENGFRLVGDMDEWEVAGFLDRAKQRITFAGLYCDKKSVPAFTQLFTELFDTIHQVTGETCNPHFQRHIDELPNEIPRPVIARLKSIMGLDSQESIDEWHAFVASRPEPAIQNWYAHKLANPWVLPSVNRFLSKISNENWDITPNHSNYVETAHAGRNAETSTSVGLLTAILQARERDNIRAAELAQINRTGLMHNRWNGIGERERLSAQCKGWEIKKTVVRNTQLDNYDTIKAELENGAERNRESLKRSKELTSQIKGMQEGLRIDKHRIDLREKISDIRQDVNEEMVGFVGPQLMRSLTRSRREHWQVFISRADTPNHVLRAKRQYLVPLPLLAALNQLTPPLLMMIWVENRNLDHVLRAMRRFCLVFRPRGRWICSSISNILHFTGTIFTHGFPEYMSDILIPSAYNGPGEQGNLGAFIEDLEYYPPNILHGALEFPIQGIDQLSDPTISFNYEVINPNDYLNMRDGANFNTANFDIGMAHFTDPLSTNYSRFPDFDQCSFNSTGGLEIPVFHSADLHDQYRDDLPMLPMPQSSPITTVQEEPIQHQAAAKKTRKGGGR
ncbi:hypothetical protein B0H10DRAFT_2184143 [Mycena sp. CBHHK59/15]|nr:hypothetical protein B0H10DRAFT_2184143 [Mycena sp. CBHHK59/15]